MTWSGWAANLVTKEPEPPKKPSRKSGGPITLVPPAAHSPPGGRGCGGEYGTGGDHADPAPAEATAEATAEALATASRACLVKAELAAQDEYLDSQLAGLETLAQLGGRLSEAATEQCAQVGAMDWRVERLNDETRAQIRMQGRLHKSVRGAPTFGGFVALEHLPSKRLLATLGGGGGPITLVPPAAHSPPGGRGCGGEYGSAGRWGGDHADPAPAEATAEATAEALATASRACLVKAELAAQDEYLDSQLAGLETLAQLGGRLSEAATEQCAQVGAMDWRVERLNDETRAQIRMQGRLHKSVRGAPTFGGFV
eukprot:CAMPEP_0172650408 /NCGR_PEP_ID=MMETSP1068-20121228/242281_1 /TAXON_ID=35684 /ORGANISM="Pseudopedinella elastica, Strain CCMP716" /LENGTH=312 /DNA_ID=CAMNT_0013464775 /DNA_START=460 /DNA_END=1395 /DNA_ORIENTATION=+